jgi:hypothetical protein
VHAYRLAQIKGMEALYMASTRREGERAVQGVQFKFARPGDASVLREAAALEFSFQGSTYTVSASDRGPGSAIEIVSSFPRPPRVG